jgi:hypothetical protein
MVLSIGNLPPGASATVVFVLSFPVKCEGGLWQLVLPESLVPLCTAGEG